MKIRLVYDAKILNPLTQTKDLHIPLLGSFYWVLWEKQASGEKKERERKKKTKLLLIIQKSNQ